MKKISLLSLSLLFTLCVSAQQGSIIEKIFKERVEEKVSFMQEIIGFSDEQAEQLKEVEFNFLIDVNKAEHCFLCKKQKRIEKLKKERDAQLQKILERHQYIKYDAIENERVEKGPPIKI